MLIVSFFGCASTPASGTSETHVRLTDDGRIYVGNTYTGLSKLVSQLKRDGIEQQTRIMIEIPNNTAPSALSAIGRELASNGYRRFVFSKPRKAVAKKSVDPILKNLSIEENQTPE